MALTPNYWEDRYQTQSFPWDLGLATRPMRNYIDALHDRGQRILIPGGGLAHELAYLHELGFSQSYSLDWAVSATARGRAQYPQLPASAFITEDFFTHSGTYDLILEQTFFCALQPDQRAAYARKMFELLRPAGRLAGVLFEFPLTENGPPFGGNRIEYAHYFRPYFHIRLLDTCRTSEPERRGRELFLIAERLHDAR